MTERPTTTARFATVFGEELKAVTERRDTLGVSDVQIQELRNDIARKAGKTLASGDAVPPDVGFPLRDDDRFGNLPANCNLFGLALSGGGVRSAALCLGVTQALNKCGILRLTDYLSTVSGGGYLGCSLASNWWGAHNIRWPADPAALKRWRDRVRDGSEPYKPYWDESPGAPPDNVAAVAKLRWYFPFPHIPGVSETAMMRQLRGHAEYLTPRGLAAAIRYAPALFVRAWILNALALVPILLFAAGLLGAWIDISSCAWMSGGWFDVSTPAKAGRLAACAGLVFVLLLAAMYVVSRPARLALERGYEWRRRRRLQADAVAVDARPMDPVAADDWLDLKWLARETTRDLVDVVTVAIVGLAVLAAHPYLVWLVGGWLTSPQVGGGAIGIAALAGAIGAVVRQIGALPAIVRHAITVAALTIAGPLLLWLSTLAMAAWLGGTITQLAPVGIRTILAPSVWGVSGWQLALLAALVAAPAMLLVLTRWLYDCNEVALHAFYRDKLSRTFLFALHPLNRRWTVHADDLKLSDMETRHAPYPIINVALNTAGDRAHWSRGRSCDFFVFTPRYVGGPATGYCPTIAMESINARLKLASAMAISGAAFSAVAGRNTIGYARFLLALFNVRLGYWLPHPRAVARTAGRGAFRGGIDGWVLGDRPGPAYFLAELLGMVRAQQRFVYLTDGGHIENMGLYELIRRRCRLIIVVDAEQDDARHLRFSGIADAIRFVRIDSGVQIDIDFAAIRQDDKGISQKSWAVGTINYGRGPEGLLVYLKSSLTADIPEDIRKYRMSDPRFPHQPTTDQFFDEEQFEAYRALGYHIADHAMTALVDPEIRERLQRAQQR